MAFTTLTHGLQLMAQKESATEITEKLGPHRLLVTMDKAKAAASQYAFNYVRDAFNALTPGTEDDPMVMLFEPGVYWTDDPDDPAIRGKEGTGTPFAIKVKCSNLVLHGLTDDPELVVLACNRGQTQGAIGNFTMFLFEGNVKAENLTMGNYCNIDLDYKANPTLSRKRRMKAIVQAQLAICRNTDKVEARNCRFVSRLNLCPFVGAREELFYDCHFESTDDALPGNAVFRNCHFDFYGDMPFYSTDAEGAKFIDCTIDTHFNGKLRWTKERGRVEVRNTTVNGQLIVCDTIVNGPRPKGQPVEQKLGNGWLKHDRKGNETALSTTFIDIDVRNNTEVKPGCWTFDSYKPADTAEYDWKADNNVSAWYYGTGEDGSLKETGLVTARRGARCMFTPARKKTKGMDIAMEIAPGKQGGQGFGSATGQYMDICIAFDTHTLTGYALRMERTPRYGNAVEAWLIEYRNGTVKALTTPVATSAFRTICTVNLGISNGKLRASVTSSAPQRNDDSEILPYIDLQADVAKTTLGGFAIQHTGSTGGSAALIRKLDICWE